MSRLSLYRTRFLSLTSDANGTLIKQDLGSEHPLDRLRSDFVSSTDFPCKNVIFVQIDQQTTTLALIGAYSLLQR